MAQFGRIKLKNLALMTATQGQQQYQYQVQLDIPYKNYSIFCDIGSQFLKQLSANLNTANRKIESKNTNGFKMNINHARIKKDCTIQLNAIEPLNQARSERSNLQIFNQNSSKSFYSSILCRQYHCSYKQSPQKLLVLTIPNSPSPKFKLHMINKPKLAKTSYLQEILTNTHQYQLQQQLFPCLSPSPDHGIITMDQSSRFMLEPYNCQFPAIGVWVRCRKINENSWPAYHALWNFIYQANKNNIKKQKQNDILEKRSKNKEKINEKDKKYKVCWEGNDYFIFGRVWKQQLPELYLASWKQQQNKQQKQTVTQYEIKPNKNIKIQLTRPNLQFTLRGKSPMNQQTSPQINKTIDYLAPPYANFASPQKRINQLCQSPSIQTQLQKLNDLSQLSQLSPQKYNRPKQLLRSPQSPQFSSIKKYQWASWLEEKTYLLEKIEKQDQIIFKMAQEIEYLKTQKQKNICKSCGNKGNNNRSNGNVLAMFKSPSLVPSSQAAERIKKLSQSDLQSSPLNLITKNAYQYPQKQQTKLEPYLNKNNREINITKAQKGVQNERIEIGVQIKSQNGTAVRTKGIKNGQNVSTGDKNSGSSNNNSSNSNSNSNNNNTSNIIDEYNELQHAQIFKQETQKNRLKHNSKPSIYPNYEQQQPWDIIELIQ